MKAGFTMRQLILLFACVNVEYRFFSLPQNFSVEWGTEEILLFCFNHYSKKRGRGGTVLVSKKKMWESGGKRSMCINICKSKRNGRRLAKGQQSLKKRRQASPGRPAHTRASWGRGLSSPCGRKRREDQWEAVVVIVQNKHQPNPIAKPLQRGLA